MLEKTWKSLEGRRVKDLIGEFKQVIGEAGETEVHVGTDSQQAGRFTEFVTVMAILDKGHGGRVFYTREKVERVKNLRERLMKEVWLSVTTGLEINEYVPSKDSLLIHVDANPDVHYKSSAYIKELTAMVVSQGFRHILKPDAWVASHVADHIVKHKVLGM
jgi:uncharacterized protein